MAHGRGRGVDLRGRDVHDARQPPSGRSGQAREPMREARGEDRVEQRAAPAKSTRVRPLAPRRHGSRTRHESAVEIHARKLGPQLERSQGSRDAHRAGGDPDMSSLPSAGAYAMAPRVPHPDARAAANTRAGLRVAVRDPLPLPRPPVRRGTDHGQCSSPGGQHHATMAHLYGSWLRQRRDQGDLRLSMRCVSFAGGSSSAPSTHCSTPRSEDCPITARRLSGRGRLRGVWVGGCRGRRTSYGRGWSAGRVCWSR